MPPEIPVSASASVVSITIKINGQVLSNIYPLNSVEVFNKVDEITWASICFLDRTNAASFFSISDDDTFLAGVPIEVLTGYGKQVDIIFKGVVVSQEVQLDTHAAAFLYVKCKHIAITMRLSRMAHSSNGTESEALAMIISGYNINSQIFPTTLRLGNIGQTASKRLGLYQN